jgi:hypothetical protein
VPAVSPRQLAALALAGLALALAGCGGDGGDDGSADERGPILGRRGDEEAAAPELGFPGFATKNTTRVGGGDAVADAAGVAEAVYPARGRETRPAVVVLADARDWRAAISAAQLASRPLRAPVLLSRGGELPAATRAALDRLAPSGARRAGGAQVIRIGGAARPEGLQTTGLTGADFAELAVAIDRVQSSAARGASDSVVVAPSDRPELAMPAAAWAAKSGDPVLWASRDAIPAATREAITGRDRPDIHVLGPPDAISDAVLEQLDRLGTAHRVGARDPVANAIAFARYSRGSFGWNVVDPGHGLVFASTRRPLDAAAAAPLSAHGSYGPLLLLTDAGALPETLQGYLLDIQPGYESDPVRGVYNHGWLMGDETAISVAVQSRIDTLLEIQPVGDEEP